jgi:hypothetical protein
MAFAEAATARGDLDLALSIYETTGQANSEAADRVRQLRSHREDSHQRVARYSVLFTQSPEAGLLIELSSGLIVEANETFATLFGYAEDEVVGRSVSELNLWAEPQRRSQLADQLKRTGAIENFEAVFLRSDGQRIDVLISGRVVEVNGQPMILSSIRDISLRKQAENELRKHRKRLRDLQHLAGLATWSYDVRSGRMSWSEEAFTLSGYTPGEAAGQCQEFLEMIHPDDRTALRAAIQTAIQSGSAYELVLRQRGARDSYKRVIIRGQPILNEQGDTVEVYGVLIPQKAS